MTAPRLAQSAAFYRRLRDRHMHEARTWQYMRDETFVLPVDAAMRRHADEQLRVRVRCARCANHRALAARAKGERR